MGRSRSRSADRDRNHRSSRGERDRERERDRGRDREASGRDRDRERERDRERDTHRRDRDGGGRNRDDDRLGARRSKSRSRSRDQREVRPRDAELDAKRPTTREAERATVKEEHGAVGGEEAKPSTALPPPPPLPPKPTPQHAPNVTSPSLKLEAKTVPVAADDLLAEEADVNGGGAAKRGSPGPGAQTTNGRQEPLSLEELLKRKKMQQELDAKPRFLSKKEREALALERLQVQRSNVGPSGGGGAANGAHGSLPPPPPPPRPPHRGDRGDDRGGREGDRGVPHRDSRDFRGREWDRDRDRAHDRDRGDRGRFDREPQQRGGGARAGADDARARPGAGAPEKPTEEREREKELEMIKQQYLGLTQLKKRVVKPSEKFKFNFDWGAEEDTSRDLNPLYANPHEATLLYGRGMRAGIDRREQKKRAAEFEAEMLRKARSAMGLASDTVQTRAADLARAKLADVYDGADMKVEKHWTDKSLEEMTERDWRIFREDYNIAYKGSAANVLPLRNWHEAGFPPEIMKAIEKVGYKKPSPIQMAAIPLGLQQRDVIGIAETGSGKTAAFVLPMLTYIMKQPPMTEANSADGPYAVVLAPTRELAQQIEEESIKLAEFTRFKTVSIVGGQSIEDQGAKLRKGCEIVIATPYRLLDCLEQHYAVLNQCHYIVLDEADRMIDLGFEPQVLGVMEAMPSSNLRPETEEEEAVRAAPAIYRTTYMFSATMPAAVERLARKYLRRPVVVTIGSAGRATDNVTQRVVVLKDNEKPSRLETELELVDEKRAIVFVNTKRHADDVYGKLDSLGYRCAVLHGGRSQDQREAAIKGFRDDTYNVLIATDVAGRGIDVPDVALVINYDMPNTIEPYTHRIGRTGRAGKKGTAISFLTMGDTEIFYDLKKLLEESKAAVPPELARHEAAKVKPGSIEAKSKRPDIQFAKK